LLYLQNFNEMKYTTEITIELPREKVIELFDSTENMFKWQDGLLSFDHIEGEPGQVGARSNMEYKSRKGKLVMTETITKRNFPDEFHASYKARGVYNEMYNYFTESSSQMTHWKTVSVFRFRGLIALMAPFMKSAFTGSTQLNMERFKTFAEQYENN
jgi:hypothetical protein